MRTETGGSSSTVLSVSPHLAHILKSMEDCSLAPICKQAPFLQGLSMPCTPLAKRLLISGALVASAPLTIFMFSRPETFQPGFSEGQTTHFWLFGMSCLGTPLQMDDEPLPSKLWPRWTAEPTSWSGSAKPSKGALEDNTHLWIFNSSGEDTSPPFLTDAWLVPLFYALIMLLGLVGNSLVIYVISKHRQMRTATNFYIANLATTDIIFLVCCVPFTATLYPLPSWVFGDFMCKFVNYLQQVTVQATCITLMAMSIDRCYATLYPLQSLRYRTPQIAMAVSFAIWIGSFILSLPMALYHRTEVGYWYGLRTYCIESFTSKSQERSFILYTFLAVYLFPLFTICLCYSIMLKRIGNPVVEPIDQDYQVQHLSERSAAMRAKISKMVVVIVLLFTICWGPIQFYLLFQGFYHHFQANYATYKIKTWANCMSYANSSLNPIVYAFMGDSFRKSFKKAFPFLFRQRVQDNGMRSGCHNAELKFVT